MPTSAQPVSIVEDLAHPADASGNQKVSEQFAFGFNPTNITTAVATLVKTGAGVLKRIVINKPVATGVVTIYDNTANSGTKIGTITTPAGPTGPYQIDYDVMFATGLTIDATVAAQDITVVWA
jgi:hypothetical protein